MPQSSMEKSNAYPDRSFVWFNTSYISKKESRKVNVKMQNLTALCHSFDKENMETSVKSIKSLVAQLVVEA